MTILPLAAVLRTDNSSALRDGLIGPVQPRVSVVIPHLNQAVAATVCLRSLAEQSYPAEMVEIIVVDNGSTQDISGLHAAFPGVTFLAEPEPGPGNARNTGVAASTGEMIAFIDADCRAHPQWIESAVSALTQTESTGVVGGDVRIDCADEAVMTGLEAYESVFAYRQKMYIEKMHFSGTGNLAVRADVFAKVGTFGGIAVAEDRDWGRRAQAIGHPACYVPSMIIWHPARTHFADMKDKWRRHIAHDLQDHRTDRKSVIRWWLHAVAVAVSAGPDIARIIVSDRLTGVGNRLRAAAVLIRIRLFRAVEMIRQSLARSGSAAAGWNRS